MGGQHLRVRGGRPTRRLHRPSPTQHLLVKQAGWKRLSDAQRSQDRQARDTQPAPHIGLRMVANHTCKLVGSRKSCAMAAAPAALADDSSSYRASKYMSRSASLAGFEGVSTCHAARTIGNRGTRQRGRHPTAVLAGGRRRATQGQAAADPGRGSLRRVLLCAGPRSACFSRRPLFTSPCTAHERRCGPRNYRPG